MDDLISRQAVKELAHNQMREKYCGKQRDFYIKLADSIIDLLPSIQPKRGRWIEDKGQQTLMQNFIERGEVWRVCSVCGAGHMIGHKYECDKAYHETHHNFCPNCGCRMDGGE